MRTCERCNVEKNESQFRPFGRGRKKVCKSCEGLDQGEAVIAARSAPGLSGEVLKETPHLVKIHAALEIPAGLGFRASIEGELLQVEQDRSDDDGTYTHSLTLNRVEAQRFIDWISRLVEPEAA